ncbi:MAG: MMPL family transporter [Oscillibacter sp.]|nr:MMPL family transporter [Oscillibacter sp.]
MNQTVRKKKRPGIPERLCALASEKSRACCLLALALAVLCCLTGERAVIRDNPAAYLPEDSETRRGLAVMEAEFKEPVTRRILVDNIAAPQAAELAERLSLAAGVRSADFDEATDYQTGIARLTVAFRDEDTEKAFSQLRFMLEGYDYSVVGDAGGANAFPAEIRLAAMLAFAAALVALAALTASPAVAGAAVVLLTFGAAFLFDSGTRFLLGEISPAAAWGSALLQLALCLVCVPPMFRRYRKARARMDRRDALLAAWQDVAPAILCGGAALTLSLLAMGLLHLRTGFDPGFVTAKAVALTLATIFFLTPALLAELCEFLDRALPREDAAKASASAEFAFNTRFAVPALFAAALIAANVGAGYFPRVYGPGALPIRLPWGAQKAEAQTEALFGADNELSILIPAGDASRESALLAELSALDEVRTARGLANMEIMGGYALAERLTPRQFAELMDIDTDAARQIYAAYIEAEGAYGHLSAGADNAAIPLANMLLFACDRAREGYVTLNWGGDNALELLYRRTENALLRMGGDNYSRLILNLSIPQGSSRSFAFLYTLKSLVGRYYPEGALFAGDAVRDADLSAAFRRDSVLFFALTFSAALVALYFALGSFGAALASAAVAQGGAWITFALWLAARQSLYFLADLLVGAALMAVGLVFASLIAARCAEYGRGADAKTALAQALRDMSPAVKVSGTSAALIFIAIGIAAPNRVASSFALCLGAGMAISAFLTLRVLPQALLFAGAANSAAPAPERVRESGTPPERTETAPEREYPAVAESASGGDEPAHTESAWGDEESPGIGGGTPAEIGAEESGETAEPAGLAKTAQESAKKEASDDEE